MKFFVPSEISAGRHHEDLCRNAVVSMLQILGHVVVDWPDDARDGDRAVQLTGADACFFTLRNPKHKPGWKIADVRGGVLKVQLVADFQYEQGLQDYAGCDLLLLRYPSAVDRANLMGTREKIGSCQWLLHSFDPEVIPKETPVRDRCVAVLGSLDSEFYPVRSAAARTLGAAGLLYIHDTNGGPVLSQADYYRRLLKSEAALACGSIFDFPVAKHVEIPAAGALLFTNAPRGIDRYLPPHLYVRYTPDDIVQKAQALLGTVEAAEKARVAREYVHVHHTHAVRAKELAEMLKCVAS